MRRGLNNGFAIKIRAWAILCALGAFFGAVSLINAGDRKTKIITFEASAVHTAGTEYSSGFLMDKYQEGVLLVNVSALSGTPTLDLTIQTSDDNSTYFYHSVIEQISAAGTTAYPLTNFGKYLRLKEVVTGTTSITYEIKAVGKN
ncbi:MAG: hypothetical protein SV375_00080 [Thermodesulfobacteriota bacterium]|nr:hypothetical protein [Thermodesulfobacteriota bacterium]